MIPAMSFDNRQIEDDPRADVDAEAAVKRELEAFLREHGGFEGLAGSLAVADRNAWRYEAHAYDNEAPKRAGPWRRFLSGIRRQFSHRKMTANLAEQSAAAGTER